MIKNDIFSIYYDNGFWLAKYDTSVAGKFVKLKKITSFNGYSGGYLQTYSDSLLYFYFTDLQNTRFLWSTNGTPGGTVQLFSDSIASNGFTTFGNKLYFNRSANNTGYELWSTDGSIAGTQMVKDINPGIYGSDPAAFTAFKSSLLFSARDNSAGTELWRTDGTSAGTYMVKNINTTSTASASPDLYDYSVIDTINNRLLFTSMMACMDGSCGVRMAQVRD